MNLKKVSCKNGKKDPYRCLKCSHLYSCTYWFKKIILGNKTRRKNAPIRRCDKSTTKKVW